MLRRAIVHPRGKALLLALALHALGVSTSPVRAQEPPPRPVSDDARLALELRDVELRLAQLERERGQLFAGPVALASMGYLAGAGLGFLSFLTAVVGRNSTADYLRVSLPLGLGAAAALGVGVAATVFTVQHADERPSRRQIRELRTRRRQIVRVAPELARTGFGLRLGWDL